MLGRDHSDVDIVVRRNSARGVSAVGIFLFFGATSKTPVFCAVERGGELRRRVVADVTAATLRDAICEEVDSRAPSDDG
jgi:hypothetical protein